MSQRRTVVPRTIEKIDFLRSHNRKWAVGILNVGSVIQWVHARRWFSNKFECKDS